VTQGGSRSSLRIASRSRRLARRGTHRMRQRKSRKSPIVRCRRRSPELTSSSPGARSACSRPWASIVGSEPRERVRAAATASRKNTTSSSLGAAQTAIATAASAPRAALFETPLAQRGPLDRCSPLCRSPVVLQLASVEPRSACSGARKAGALARGLAPGHSGPCTLCQRERILQHADASC
jgi:hypothetical protein